MRHALTPRPDVARAHLAPPVEHPTIRPVPTWVRIEYTKKKNQAPIDLMPDKRAGSWRGMWPGRDVAAYAKSVFSTQFSVTFTFLFPQHSRLFSSKKRELASQFSFLCMPTTVFDSNSFGVLRSSSAETSLCKFGSTPCDWQLFFPSFFCFLLDVS